MDIDKNSLWLIWTATSSHVSHFATFITSTFLTFRIFLCFLPKVSRLTLFGLLVFAVTRELTIGEIIFLCWLRFLCVIIAFLTFRIIGSSFFSPFFRWLRWFYLCLFLPFLLLSFSFFFKISLLIITIFLIELIPSLHPQLLFFFWQFIRKCSFLRCLLDALGKQLYFEKVLIAFIQETESVVTRLTCLLYLLVSKTEECDSEFKDFIFLSWTFLTYLL